MTTYLVLTAIGDDRPGLVESLSQVITENSGNWLESSMSQLAGKFAGILRVSVSDEDAELLIKRLNELSNRLKLVIERVDRFESIEIPSTVKLNLVGNDRPGIIREISHELTNMAVNVAQLTTECVPA
ncbi:MAG: ACT domain-containing protein, partial [Pseudomonadota bacterium]|nr:ACT domain-containing protein [Pseudomonadota bacterium]